MLREDLHFGSGVEEYILGAAAQQRSVYSFVEEYVVLSNVLYVERIDELGHREKIRGSFVNVGMARSVEDFDVVLLPTSGERVYLNGFDNEAGVTIGLVEDLPGEPLRLKIERNT